MSDADVQFDVVVVGGTPGGIAAALSAGRAGRKVLLIESHKRIGGMSASGLGKSDVETRHLMADCFKNLPTA
jgi:flavin-dependent dehydrogenase